MHVPKRKDENMHSMGMESERVAVATASATPTANATATTTAADAANEGAIVTKDARPTGDSSKGHSTESVTGEEKAAALLKSVLGLKQTELRYCV